MFYKIKRKRFEIIGRIRSYFLKDEPMTNPVDFVVTWVDGNDLKWKKEKELYEHSMGIEERTDNGEERYRDWDIFIYWFRAVEKYAPWVRKVHLVTWGHIPEWLNCYSPKLNIVKHTDFIPQKYLPTFNCNAIELNLHRIPDLCEHFVYFNDDVFLNRPVRPEDFFSNGKPKYTAIALPLKNLDNCAFYHMCFSVMGIINRKFQGNLSLKIKQNCDKWFNYKYGNLTRYNLYAFDECYLPGMFCPHLGIPFVKDTFIKVWNEISDELNEVCTHRFRSPKDLTHQVFSYWDIVEGNFYPVETDYHGKLFYAPHEQTEELINTIREEKYRMICINDSEYISKENFFATKSQIATAMKDRFPDKSEFEI